MKRVELLGPSGVGKTLLYHRVSSQFQYRRFLNIEEACLKAALAKQPVFPSMKYLFYLLLKSGCFKWKRQGLAHHLLLDEEGSGVAREGYWLSFKTLEAYLLQEKDAAVVKKRLENFVRNVQRNRVLDKRLERDDLVFFDEGLLHHHHGFEPELFHCYTPEEIQTDQGLQIDGIVLCDLSFGKNMERILTRKKQGIRTFSHGHLNGVALENYVFQARLEYQLKVEVLKKIGVRILRLNMEDDLRDNAERIGLFINNLTS
ncbi:hypothetical protein DBR11_00725 [Pedobacter sp. HMWF019]|uniref:hypothetical protein n=1 Tax=Pedobacter sp. HMWF019 TaxID=2056856 RepID=UPI000D3549EF|nr:hypothetical protein [Pedobacter sp. HMWF019]PTT04040.1 hypothetical protein DBR11_00725 [Pedobacter sp. HMWF019]